MKRENEEIQGIRILGFQRGNAVQLSERILKICWKQNCLHLIFHSTEHFPLQTGARQGDPSYGYLFSLALETQIRENEEIQGIRTDTQGKEVKISAYTDDGNFLVLNNHLLNIIFQTSHTFKQFSLKLISKHPKRVWLALPGVHEINLYTLTGWTWEQIKFELWVSLIAMTPTIFSRLLVKLKTTPIIAGRIQRTCQDNFTPRNSPLISPLLPQTGTDFAHTSRTAFLTYLWYICF